MSDYWIRCFSKSFRRYFFFLQLHIAGSFRLESCVVYRLMMKAQIYIKIVAVADDELS